MKALGIQESGRTKNGLPPSTAYCAELFYVPHSSIYRLPHDANLNCGEQFASHLGSGGWRGHSQNGKLRFLGVLRPFPKWHRNEPPRSRCLFNLAHNADNLAGVGFDGKEPARCRRYERQGWTNACGWAVPVRRRGGISGHSMLCPYGRIGEALKSSVGCEPAAICLNSEARKDAGLKAPALHLDPRRRRSRLHDGRAFRDDRLRAGAEE